MGTLRMGWVTLLCYRHCAYGASHCVNWYRSVEPDVTRIALTRGSNGDEGANFKCALTALGVALLVTVGEHGILVVGGPFFEEGLIPGFIDFA